MAILAEHDIDEGLAAYEAMTSAPVKIRKTRLPAYVPIGGGVYAAEASSVPTAKDEMVKIATEFLTGEMALPPAVPRVPSENWGDIGEVVFDLRKFVSDGLGNAIAHASDGEHGIPLVLGAMTTRGHRGHLLAVIGDYRTGFGERSGDITHGSGLTIMGSGMSRLGYASPADIRRVGEPAIHVPKALWGEHAPQIPVFRAPRPRQAA